MDLQSDINWLKSELDSVRDPHLIEAFKQLLKYRNSVKLNISTEEEDLSSLKTRAEDSLESIERGRVRNINEFKKDVEAWKSQKGM